jgi:hypothetical protein
MSTITWSTLGTFTTAIAGASTAPTLKNLANNGQKIGSEIDVTGIRNLYADFELYCRFVTAPTAGGLVSLYFIQALDGTNYADGDDSVAPPQTAWAGVFPLRAVTTQQRIVLRHVLLPNTKFKPLLINKSGYAMTNTDNENILSIRQYSEEIT